MPVFSGDEGVARDLLTKDKIREMLKRADTNGDGDLDRKELKKVFDESGSHWAARRADRSIQSCDIDCDGLIGGRVEFEKLVEYAFIRYGDKKIKPLKQLGFLRTP